MQFVPVLVTLLASALAVPRGYTYVPPPQKSYIPPPPQEKYIPPPPQEKYIPPPPQEKYIPPPQEKYIPRTEKTAARPRVPAGTVPTAQQTRRVPSRPQKQLQPVPSRSTFRQLVPSRSTFRRPVPSGSTFRKSVVTSSKVRQPVPSRSTFRRPDISGSASQLPARYTELDYSPNAIVNRNPGTGNSGPMGVFVGACSASMVCVPEAMCNPYTGFVRGGLLREPTGPSSTPTVALLRCYRLKDGGIGDGVCCRMPHINDPWPDLQ